MAPNSHEFGYDLSSQGACQLLQVSADSLRGFPCRRYPTHLNPTPRNSPIDLFCYPTTTAKADMHPHCQRLGFLRFSHHESISLGHHVVVALAPPELPGSGHPRSGSATTDALTPERRLFVSLSGTMNTVLSARVALLHAIEPSDHSVSNHPLPLSKSGLVSIRDLPCDTAHTVRILTDHCVNWASPVTNRLAATASCIEFVFYGLVIHLPFLSTSPHGDAVTFDYNVQTQH